jgi:hypothetical protein
LAELLEQAKEVDNRTAVQAGEIVRVIVAGTDICRELRDVGARS